MALMSPILPDKYSLYVVAGTSEQFDVFEKVKHYRIPGSQWFGNNLVALGMIYFRLMDLR